MGKIRKKDKPIKIDGKSLKHQGCSSEQHPWFSFKYMTTNSDHCIKALPDGREREITISKLYEKLEELSKKEWIYWTQQPKRIGLETISVGQLDFSPSPDANITQDSTLYVFQFDTHKGSRQGRIIGFKSSPCATLHIIGYDFDFSAYNHGH